MKRTMIIILLMVVLVECYVALNNNYLKGVEACSKNHDLEYCKVVMSK